jgi:hypothetical protein
MRKIIFICLISFVTVTHCYAQVNVIESRYKQLDSIILDIYNNYYEYNISNVSLVINAYEYKEETYWLSIGILNRDEFSWLLRDSKDKLYGYFEINNYPIVIFGNFASIFFNELGCEKYINWLIPLPPKKHLNVKNEEEYPPVNFEPLTKIYKFDNGKFIFIRESYFMLNF